MPTQEQIIKDLQDFTVRLQKQVNDLQKKLDDISLVPSDTLVPSEYNEVFEDRVWESVLTATISNMLNPSQIIPPDERTQMKMMQRALGIADKWVEAAKEFKQEKENQKKQKQTKADPIKELLDK